MRQRNGLKLHDSEKVHCNGSYSVSVLITGQLEECLPQQPQMPVDGDIVKHDGDKCPCQCWRCQGANECSRTSERRKGDCQQKMQMTCQLIPHWTWLLIGRRTTNKLIYLKLVPFRSTSIDSNQEETIEFIRDHHQAQAPLSGPIERRGVLLIAFQIAPLVHMLVFH